MNGLKIPLPEGVTGSHHFINRLTFNKIINLNQPTTGIVINEDKKSKVLQVESTFSDIYSWQLDEPDLSYKTDPFFKSMSWLEISNIVIRFF